LNYLLLAYNWLGHKYFIAKDCVNHSKRKIAESRESIKSPGILKLLVRAINVEGIYRKGIFTYPKYIAAF
jgi:hypothetical protein